MSEFDSDDLKRAYHLLDVPHSASARSIKDSYRRMTKRWHPDRYRTGTPSHAEATQMMTRINEAYSLIENAPLLYGLEQATASWPQTDSEAGQFWKSVWGVISLSPLLMRIVAIPFGIMAIWLIFWASDHFPGLVGATSLHVTQSWVIGLAVAILMCYVAAKALWRFRHHWHVWVMFAGLLILHFLVAIPAFEKIGPNEARYFRLRGSVLFLLAAVEIAMTAAILRYVTSPLAKERDISRFNSD